MTQRARSAAGPASNPKARTAPPTPPASPRPGAGLAIAAALGVVVAIWIWFRLATHLQLEDALITYRHAENLALGRGFGFNPGERVLGTSTPLLTLLLAALGRVVGVARIPVISNVLMIAAGAASCALLARAFLRAGFSTAFAALTVLLIGLHPDLLWSTTGGLETPLVLCWMALGLEAALADRWNLAAVASALLVLTRPDGLVWAALLAGWAIARRGWRAWRPLALGAMLVLPWVIWASSYFGSPVPNTVTAKRAITFGAGSVKYLPWLLNSTGVPFLNNLTPVDYALWTGFLAAGATAIVARRVLRGWWTLVAFPPLFGIALALGHAPSFDWYLVPVTWCCLAAGAIGALEWRDRILPAALGEGSRRAARAIFVIACLGLAASIAKRDAAAFHDYREFQENEDGARRRIGEWLRAHSAPGAVVAMEAVGYEGTYSQRRVVDLAGVVSPAVVRAARATGTNAGTFAWILANERPDFVVLRSYEFEQNRHHYGGPLFATAADRARFAADYRSALEVTAPHPELWGANARLTVFQRVGRR